MAKAKKKTSTKADSTKEKKASKPKADKKKAYYVPSLGTTKQL